MGKHKKYIILFVLLIMIGVVIYFYYNKYNRKDNNDDNKLPIQKEEIKLNSESLKILVTHAYNQNLEEIKATKDDYKKIEKILYSKVIKECKGKASPSDIKAMIRVVHIENNK